jgi:hypothetical protein
MTEWRSLVKTLEKSLEEWPRELLPLVADYVLARLHEWDGGDTGDFLISRSRIAACVTKHAPETRRVRSKYSVTNGPSRCVLDIGFSPWFRDGLVRVRLEAPARTTGPGVWLFLKSNNTVQISFRSHFVFWNQTNGSRSAGKKIRIVMSVTKENEVQFEYGDSGPGSLQILGKIENHFDACYPAVSICNGSSVTVTWVDE